MRNELHEALERQITRIRELKAELNRLRGSMLRDELRGPASVAAIDAVERLAGFILPIDYRAFLSSHDGWHGFNGRNSLLSTSEMQGGEMKDSIEETKELQRETGDQAADGFVIEASIGDTDITYFDRANVRVDGGVDVVCWDARMREYARHASFLDYLSAYASSLERRIAKEQARLR